MDKKEEFDKVLKTMKPAFRNTPEESWAGIQNRIENLPTGQRKYHWTYWMGAAATIALIMGAAWWLKPTEAQPVEFVTAEIKEPLRIELPDGSVALLNDNSRLTYDAAAFDNARTVQLEGHAYFDVKKSGADFSIVSSHGSVTVLGTTFDVFSEANWFEVNCFSGKVAVNNPLSGVTLGPGRSAIANGGGRLVETNVSSEIPMWTKGEYTYSEKPLERVWADVEQQYNVKIKYLGEGGRTFTGYFSETFTLNETLEIICRPMGLAFEVKDKQVEITTVAP